MCEAFEVQLGQGQGIEVLECPVGVLLQQSSNKVEVVVVVWKK
jgi:hypothetical protein